MNSQRETGFVGRADLPTVLLWLVLCLIGWMNIYAAVYDPEQPEVFNMATNYGKQSIFILTALLIGLGILIIDSRFFVFTSPIAYAVVVLLLVAVLFVGKNVGGNQSWIPIGSFRLQPSEFAKLTTCLLLAAYLGSIPTGRHPSRGTLLTGAAIVLFPVFLVQMQPDTGSALVFFSLIIVFYREGYVSTLFLVLIGLAMLFFLLALLVENQWMLIGGLFLLCAMFAYKTRKRRKAVLNTGLFFAVCSLYVLSVDFAYDHFLKPHQQNRIDVVLGKKQDPRGTGYQTNQSMIAIGSGQLMGKGFLKGTQTKYNFVPEQSTDFIFCTVGEEWGFVGSVTVIGLYLFLLLRIVHIAERQRTAVARIYGYGVVSILFFHFLINIGITIGLVPVIGIPLPFLSYGGSSLWSFTILLFILLRFDSGRKGLNG